MPIHIPFYRRTLPPDLPAIVQSVVPLDPGVQPSRPLFKAPPLQVQPPSPKAIGFDSEIRDRIRVR
jgi:hypothetical protein